MQVNTPRAMNITVGSNKVSARVINVNRVKNVKILRAQCYRESKDAGLRQVRQPAGSKRSSSTGSLKRQSKRAARGSS